MLLHYLKIAFRNLRKYRTQSLTGIFGLAFGVACFVPAYYWMRYETSYDSFYPDAAHIYRIYSVDKQSGKVNELVPEILERKLHEQVPAMANSTVFFIEPDNCSVEGTPYIRLHILHTDTTFFRVFPQVVISGDARKPLQVMNNIAITETVAVRLFGDVEKAIGQRIQSTIFSMNPPYTVTAVVKDPPPNTNLKDQLTNIAFDAVIFSEVMKFYTEDLPEDVRWTVSAMQVYAKFYPNTDVNELAVQLRDFTSRVGVNDRLEVRMLPISDIRHRLDTDVPFTLNFIRLFIASGILLLFSALFNFLNLYLDLFRQRIRELRQRTVHGATSGQLILQMMFEMSCTILLALALACCFVVITCPVFSGLIDIAMGLSQLIRLFVVCGIGVMMVMLFIGLIPFWRLSRLAMRDLSKRKITGGQPVLRRIAVTLQLAVSVVFIVAALVVMMQMRFVNHKDLGFDRTGIIQLSGLDFSNIPKDKATALMHELAAIPQIEYVTTTLFEPEHNANPQTITSEVEWPEKPLSENSAFHIIQADSLFAKTFGLKMLMGKWLDNGGSKKIVLNEEAVRTMGLSEPVGAVIRMSSLFDGRQEYEVAGVVKDFNTLSLRSRILPTIFIQYSRPETLPYNIRAFPGQEQEAMRRINAILPGIDASMANVHLTPISELYDRLNRSERAGLKLFSVLATVCLLISLFGIYAVATASTQRRRKEIAIRKVMGAKVTDIIRMFFREHTLQVVLASVVALPLAYLAMSRWLQGYAYHTNIPWWLLAGVVFAVVAVVLLTVLGQVWKAAGSNPADVVKNE